jgi:ferredoxin
MAFDFKSAFERALPYPLFLQKHGSEVQRDRWRDMYDKVKLTPQQDALLASFARQMNVLCTAGVWCGDCVNACPIFQRIAEASERIDLRFIHRPINFDEYDNSPDTALIKELMLCGGPRVPMLVFLSEDWYECERFGERTLATYRSKVAKAEGLSCPIGVVPPQDLLAANVAEWLEHFERVQLILLTSPRLMQIHSR